MPGLGVACKARGRPQVSVKVPAGTEHEYRASLRRTVPVMPRIPLPTRAVVSREPASSVARLLPAAALALVATVWGVTFTVVDDAVTVLPAAELVMWRFGLGTAALWLVSRSASPLPSVLRSRGIVLGGLLGAGFLLQGWALA